METGDVVRGANGSLGMIVRKRGQLCWLAPLRNSWCPSTAWEQDLVPAEPSDWLGTHLHSQSCHCWAAGISLDPYGAVMVPAPWLALD